jgi:hypothetical protein
VHHILQETHQP